MRRGVITGVFIAVATVALPGAVRAVTTTDVTCGQVITQSIVVGNVDASACTGHGLVIGAPNVTINLNGHTITGDGSGGGNGIDDGDGFARLTVLNGSVTGFESGIAVANGSKVKVAGVTSYANLSKGIVTDGTLGVTIQSSYTHGNPDAGIDVLENAAGPVNISGVGSNGDGDGIEVTGGPTTINANVLANEGDIAITVTSDGYKVTNNRVISANGAGVSGTGAGTVSGNTITRAGTVGIATSGGQITKNTIGVTTNASIYANGSVKTTISDNVVAASNDSGIDLASGGAGSVIQNNVIGFAYGSPGIHAAVDGVTIKGNSVGTVANGSTGIAVQASNATIANNKVGSASSDGFSITGAHETVSGNTVASAGTGEGFFINAGSSKITSNTVLHAGDNGMYIALVDGDLIQGNLFEGAAHDGLRLDSGGHTHTVKGNTARGNNEIGIHDQGATGTTLTANVAIDNTNGIETTGGVDGGKNKAAGNTDTQCAGVVCTAP